jgi:hypothetical protein
MFSIEGLQQQLSQYQSQQKNAEQLFHQCAGVIAMLSQQITLLHQADELKKAALEKEKGESSGEVDEQAAQ